MNLWLLISVVIHMAALAWCVVLWIRRRDTVLTIAVGLFLVMWLRLLAALYETIVLGAWLPLDRTVHPSDPLSLATSLLCITVIVLFDLSSRRDRWLAQHLRLLGSALEDSAEAAMITTADLNNPGPIIVWINDSACALFGMTREELVGQSPPVLRSGNTEHATAALRQTDTFEGESACQHGDGTEFRLHSTVSPIRNARGARTNFLVISRDVTRRHAAEQALAESEAKYRQVVDSAPDAVAIHEGGKVVFVNATGLRLLGARTAQDVIGRPFLDFVHPDERRSSIERARHIIDGKQELPPAERRLLRLDGSTVEVELAAAPCTHHGLPAAMIFARDLTDRKRDEWLLRQSEQRLSQLVRQSPLGAIVWDLDFKVVEWNPAAERMFGYAEHEAIAHHAEFIIPPESRAHVDAIWSALLRRTGGTHSTNENLTRDGRRIYCDWYNTPLLDAEGRVSGVASLVDDVSDRLRAEERQRLLMLELDHRVKNNLAVVISLAEHTLHTAHSLPEFSEAFLGRIRALARMHTLLAQSRWKGAPLRELLEGSLEAFTAGERDRITMLGPGVSLVTREASAVNMVIHELATNAAKYGALSVPSGHVSIEWHLLDDENGQTLKLSWAEIGGPPVTPPSRRGVGVTVVQEAIGYELRGTVDLQFAPTGVRCDMTIPRTSGTPTSTRLGVIANDIFAAEVAP